MEFGSSGIEVVFLDAGGTLFEVRGSVGEIYSRFALRYGVHADARDLDSAFGRVFRTAPPLAFSKVEGNKLVRAERGWWKEVIRRVFKDAMPEEVLRDYLDEIFEFFRTDQAWRLFPDTRPSLERLRRVGYRLSILSNSDSRIHDVLASLQLDPFFERVTVSSLAGVIKPNPEIFHKALEAMRVPAFRALHAGDSLEEDVEGAHGAGLSAVLIDRQRKYTGWTGGRRVRSLAELCDELGA